MRYRVVVTGSRPEKGPDGKFLPMPEENVAFIKKVLGALPADQYVALYHGMANGVDTIADDYAFENRIRVRQYPAYWFNPAHPNNFDKAAGFFRNERMVRDAKQHVWVPDGQTPTEEVVVLGFHNKPLAESKGTAHTIGLAEKLNLTTRVFALPVQISAPVTTPEANSDPFQF